MDTMTILIHSRQTPQPVPMKLVWLGFIAGLNGTLVMDLLLMAALWIMGTPPLTCFSMVGDTVSRLLSQMGIQLWDSIRMGVITHYTVGPVIGTIYGFLVNRIDTLRTKSMLKGIAQAVLFVEIVSLPMLMLTPFILKLSFSDTLQWFGGSFVMHFIWGVVFGGVIHNFRK